jgi:hypothetical protein
MKNSKKKCQKSSINLIKNDKNKYIYFDDLYSARINDINE